MARRASARKRGETDRDVFGFIRSTFTLGENKRRADLSILSIIQHFTDKMDDLFTGSPGHLVLSCLSQENRYISNKRKKERFLTEGVLRTSLHMNTHTQLPSFLRIQE